MTLLVEDDDVIGGLVSDGLSGAGHDVVWARTAREAREALVGDAVLEVCVLDLGLPDGEGLDICRALRRRSPETLIVVVTARRESIDIVAGLDAGADDYVVKPFTLAELQARLRAHSRRLGGRPRTAPQDTAVVVCGSLRVDRAARRASVAGVEVTLREKEYALLELLVLDAGQAVARDSVLARLWDSVPGAGKSLDVTMTTLRRRLEEAADGAGAPVPVITTLRGFGYRVELEGVETV